MKAFYKNTYYLWVISKAILAIAGLISTFSIFSENRYLSSVELLANVIAIIYSILLGIDVACSIARNYYKVLKYITGTISMLLGIGLLIVLLYLNPISLVVTLLFVVWVLLMGLFDLLRIKREEVYEDEYLQ